MLKTAVVQIDHLEFCAQKMDILRSEKGNFSQCHGISAFPQFFCAQSGNSMHFRTAMLKSKFHIKFRVRVILHCLRDVNLLYKLYT